MRALIAIIGALCVLGAGVSYWYNASPSSKINKLETKDGVETYAVVLSPEQFETKVLKGRDTEIIATAEKPFKIKIGDYEQEAEFTREPNDIFKARVYLLSVEELNKKPVQNAVGVKNHAGIVLSQDLDASFPITLITKPLTQEAKNALAPLAGPVALIGPASTGGWGWGKWSLAILGVVAVIAFVVYVKEKR